MNTIFKMKLTDFQTYHENPTIATGIIVRQGIIKEKGETVISEDTGEVMRVYKAADYRQWEHDGLGFKKVYNNSIPEIKNFSTPALKMWCYIMENMPINKDEILISVKEALEYTGYDTVAPIYKGIIELLDKKFIFRKIGNGAYFLNIEKFFNGKRK